MFLSHIKCWRQALIVCLLFSFSVYAGEKARIDIEVTDQQEARLGSAAAAQVILPKQVQGFAQTVPELLERAAGMHLQSYGGLDDFSTVSIRGSTTDQVLIYLDGILLNSAEGGAVDLSFLPLDNIERIEIYRGGSPGKIVDSTPGGVILIHTKGKPDKTQNLLRNSAGSYYTFRGHAQRSQSIMGAGVAPSSGKTTEASPSTPLRGFADPREGNFYYTAAFDYFRSRGNFPYVNDNGTRANKNDDRVINRANNDFENFDGIGIFGRQARTGLNFKMFENIFKKDQGIPGLGNFTATDARLGTLRNFLHGILENTAQNAGDFKWEGHLFLDYLNSRFRDPQGQIGLGIQDNSNSTWRTGPEFHVGKPAGIHQMLSSFLAYRAELFLPTNHTATPPAGPTSQRHMVGLGFEDELNFRDEKLILDPSLRLQVFVNRLSGQDPALPSAVPDNDTTDTDLSAKMGVRFSPWTFLSFKGNFYRGFRQPSFSELFGDRGTFIGNPALKPEEGINFDFGVAGRWHPLSFVDDLLVEMTFFRQNTDNLIVFLQTSQFTVKAQNLNTARIIGGEFTLTLRLFEKLRINGNYVYQSAKDVGDNSPTRGKFLPGRPKNLAYLEAGYDGKFLRPFVEMQYLSGNYLDSQNLLKVQSRTLASAGIHLRPFKPAQITFTTKNLLNEQTADIAGFPLPGRSYWGELELKP